MKKVFILFANDNWSESASENSVISVHNTRKGADKANKALKAIPPYDADGFPTPYSAYPNNIHEFPLLD